MIKQKIKLIREGKLKVEENISGFIEKIKEKNKELNIVLHLNENAIKEAREIDKRIRKGEKVGKLVGLGVLVKSNINVKGLICNCASKTLENYKAGYDANVILKLKKEGVVILGMVNMDEFACGGSGETSAFGICKNPRVLSRIPGGSSSGSASGVAAEFCDFSLGSDTGGSIRNPASHCGVVGYKPSYGVVSRYGLIDLSMSLDQIGVLGNRVEDCKLVFDVIKGRDEKDSISRDFIGKEIKNKIRVGILKFEGIDGRILNSVLKKVESVCEKKEWSKGEVVLEHVDLGVQTYYPIVYTEFFSGTRKFDGRKYGLKIEDSCGNEVLRRILGGEEITKAEYGGRYYRKALMAKKLIEKEFTEAFKKFDLIVCPTVPRLPHKLGSEISVEDMYSYDVLTVLANLAELCAISVPCGFVEDDGGSDGIDGVEEIPIGLQILGAKGNDDFLLEVSGEFE